MVLLTVTTAVKAAIDAYLKQETTLPKDSIALLSGSQLGSPIEHETLITVSSALVRRDIESDKSSFPSTWSLDTLLRSSSVYKPPPPPKSEPSAEYIALMRRLRKEREQRQYDRMLAVPSSRNDFIKGKPIASREFVPILSHGHSGHEAVDEATLKDIEGQLTLIVNVLVTVIASGVTIWFAARYWAVPQRLALSMIGSLVIAIAEVVVYMGYVRRVEDAKTLERRKIERKDVADTWQTTLPLTPEIKDLDSIRYRKGKHR